MLKSRPLPLIRLQRLGACQTSVLNFHNAFGDVLEVSQQMLESIQASNKKFMLGYAVTAPYKLLPKRALREVHKYLDRVVVCPACYDYEKSRRIWAEAFVVAYLSEPWYYRAGTAFKDWWYNFNDKMNAAFAKRCDEFTNLNLPF